MSRRRIRSHLLTALAVAALTLQAPAQVQAAEDLEPPQWGAAVVNVGNITPTSIALDWTAASDNVGVIEYRVYQQGAGEVADTIPPDRDKVITDLSPNTSYTFTIEAADLAGNESTDGPEVTVSTADEIVPGAGFATVTVFQGLDRPVAVEFAPNGQVFVAEKDGVLKVFEGVGDTDGPDVVFDWTDIIMSFQDRGLLGLAVDPDYANGRDYVYVFYTYDDVPYGTAAPLWNDTCPYSGGIGCMVTAKLTRIEVDPGSRTMVGSEHLLENLWCLHYPSHSNADVEFGPDGFLYVSAGDGATPIIPDYGQWAENPCQDPPYPASVTVTLSNGEGGALRSQDLLTSTGGSPMIRCHSTVP